jgi:hypothetical protein
LSGPEKAFEHGPVVAPAQPAPPGHFLTPELESDCARFLSQVKELARRRAEELAAATAGS